MGLDRRDLEPGPLLEELKRYVGFTGEDAAILVELGARIAPSLDGMTERFYSFIRANPVVRNVIDRGGFSIPQLRLKLREWARELFGGEYSAEYARRRVAIGRVHLLIGVGQTYTSAAFDIVRNYLQEKICQACADRPEELRRSLAAFHKILDLDLCMITEGFHTEQEALIVDKKDEERRRLEERLQALTNSDQMMVLSLDRAGRLTSFNETCARVTGRPASAALDQLLAELCLPPAQRADFYSFLRRCFDVSKDSGAHAHHSCAVVDAGGRARIIDWFGAMLHDSMGLAVELVLLGHDVTEQEILQDQIVHQEKMAAIGLLAAGIAHEVGNPLASISSVAQTMQRKSSDPFIQEKLSLVLTHIQRISTIVRQMVDFARPPRFEWRPCRINATIENTLSFLRYDQRSKGVAISTDLAADLPETFAMEDQLGQVFFNIAVNALDAMQSTALERPPELRIRTRTLLTPRGRTIEVVFEDSGPGIGPEQEKRIFEPFFTTKDAGRGTGLGLPVSDRIVRDHAGRIEVEGRQGVGARFTVQLPVLEHPMGAK